MTWFALLRLALGLAAFFARRAQRRDIERAVLNELERTHKKRVDDAVAARDAVLDGSVQPDPDDPNRRD